MIKKLKVALCEELQPGGVTQVVQHLPSIFELGSDFKHEYCQKKNNREICEQYLNDIEDKSFKIIYYEKHKRKHSKFEVTAVVNTSDPSDSRK
jgi:hypothetical protein